MKTLCLLQPDEISNPELQTSQLRSALFCYSGKWDKCSLLPSSQGRSQGRTHTAISNKVNDEHFSLGGKVFSKFKEIRDNLATKSAI